MPEQQPAGENAGAQPEQTWEDKAWAIGKNVLIFVAIQFALKQVMGAGLFGGSSPKPAPTHDANLPAEAAPSIEMVGPQTLYPFWPTDKSVDVSVYISPDIHIPALSSMPSSSLVVNEKDFFLQGSKSEAKEVHASFAVPPTVQSGRTLFAHIFVGQHGAELDPRSPLYDSAKAYAMLRPLTQQFPKKKVRKTRNLLEAQGGDAAVEEEPEPAGPLLASYYHPNVSLSFVSGTGVIQKYPMLPPVTKQYYVLHDAPVAADPLGQYYYPVLYFNTFWQLRSHMVELNSTLPIERLDLNVRLSTLASWQFSLMSTMDENMKETARRAARGESTPGGGDGSEMELIKETLLDTNPWLLGTTAVVSVLHMIFELLAFKSDVGHWRKKKDNVGVSVRTILSNVVMQTIIFLYLVDNNESTSWMILFGQGMGIAIEAWKITKTVDVRVREPAADSWARGLLPRVIVFEDKHQLSETEEKTDEYDRIAFKYMGIIAVPLLLAYAAYSLVYESHKSWYSFIIATLVGSVYAYGFLMMVPSLYINYRLRSVAHMPARAMMYKFLNTFIDDLFAFTIKMPVLHRLATLRDDVIFFVYIYQAWAYKVDYTRVNEFGQGGDEEELADKVANKPLQAPADGETKTLTQDKGDSAISTGKDKSSARKRKA